MHMTLSTPYSVGDLAPDVTYPHVYVTTFYVNGPGDSVVVTYEVGTYTDDVWAKAPQVPAATMNFSGEKLYPFFISMPTTLDTPLWNQVSAIIYEQVAAQDARLQGTVG